MKKQEQKEPIIVKGFIPYILTIDPEGNFDLNYTSTLENDIAAVGISKYVMKGAIEGLEQDKKGRTGKEAQILSDMITRVQRAYFGAEKLLAHMLPSYATYRKKKPQIQEEIDNIYKTVKEQMQEMKEQKPTQHLNIVTPDEANTD